MSDQKPDRPGLGDFVAKRVPTDEGVRYYICQMHQDGTVIPGDGSTLYERPVIEAMLREKLASHSDAHAWVEETNQGHTPIGIDR